MPQEEPVQITPVPPKTGLPSGNRVNISSKHNLAPSPKRMRAPNKHRRATNRLTLQIAGLGFIILGRWAWGDPENSTLILAPLAGQFLLYRPTGFSEAE